MEFEEQLPDFILADKTGLIANGKSTIKCFNDSILVSANSTLHVYDMKSLELKENVTESIKYMITEFSRLPSDVDTGDVICYENGTLKVMKDGKVFLQYRPHYKKVNNLVLHENCIISSSTDNIVLYDIYTEEIKVWYKGLAGGVVKIAIDNEQLYVLSTDCCIRVYNIMDENTKEIHTFDNNVADFIVRNHQILLIFLDGSSKIYNSNTKEYKNFDSFKYFVTVNVYGDCLAILTTDKLHSYKGLNDDATLKKVTTIPLKQKFMDFDFASENELVLISKNNTLKKINIQTKVENTIANHQNEIFETVLIDNDIITCSSERYIVWTIDGDSVEKLHTCLFDFHAHSISKFDQNILVSSNEKLIAYDYKNNTVLFELQINNKLVKYAKGKLFVIYEGNLKIFDVSRSNNEISLNLLREDTFDSHCVFLNISNDNRLYAVSLLNNYINIYNTDNNDLKLTLYGHSLPVRYFEFSDDNKALISCGTDKLVKLWGVDFGECRKTFIADSKKISYVTNNSFVCADSGIKYYKKHDLIKHYKIKDIERTTYDKNKLIATSKFGIYHYKIGEYEFLEKEESSELEEELMKETNIINYKSYDRFLEQLNTLEDDREASMDGLFEAIKAIDLAEIDKFTYFLNQQQVKIIFTCLEKYFDSFPVVSIRFCKELIKTHSYMCANNKEIFKIYNEMKRRCKNVMDEAGCNLFEYSMLLDFQ